MDSRKVSRQHETLRVPQGWNGQDRGLVIQLERILDDIYNQLVRRVVSVLGVKPDKDGNVVLSKDDITNLGFIVDDLTSDSTDDALSAKQGKVLANRAKRVSVNAGDSVKLTSGSRSSFILLLCGGTASSHKGAYLCFAGTDAESYVVEPLMECSTATVTASSSGITVANTSTLKYIEIFSATSNGVTITNL